MAIVKVQIPLASNDPLKPALVYAKDHHLMTQQRLDSVTVVQMGSDPKAYFEADFVDGQWKIGKRVKDNPGW